MATTKKAVTVYLDHEDYAVLKRAADSTDASVSKTLGDLVAAAQPMLERVADLADAIREAPEDIRATFAGAAAELQRKGEEVLAGGDELWALFDESLGRSENGGGGDADGEPPASNTGARK